MPALVLASLINETALASPWPQEQGQALIITRAESFSSPTFQQVSSSGHIEFGLTETLTIGGKAIYASQTYGGSFPASATGFTAAELFVQKELFRTDRTVYSSRVTYAAPTKLSRQALVQNVRFNEIRYGNAVEAALLVGRSLNNEGTFFVAAESGYRHSLGTDADLVRADFLAGFKPGKRWMLLLKSFNSFGLGDAGNLGVDYDVYRLEPALTYRRRNGQAYTIGATHDLGGRNLETGSSFFFSVWNEF